MDTAYCDENINVWNVYGLCLKKKTSPFYILNNSASNEPILTSFGTLYAETTGFWTHVKFSASP